MKCSECSRRNKPGNEFCMFCAARLKVENVRSNRGILMPPQDLLLPMSEKHFLLPRPRQNNLALMVPMIILVVGLAFTIYYLGSRDTYVVQAVEYYSQFNE
jgi:hypothetical protein